MSNERNQWGEREPRVLAAGDPAQVKRASASRSRRSFLLGAAAAAAGYEAWHWINNSPSVGELQGILRKSLQANAKFDQAVFDERGLAPTYPLQKAVELRLNGVVGLEKELAPDGWRLQVAGVANPKASPHYAPDVTAWDYKYSGPMKETAAFNDVKLAPRSESKTEAAAPANGAPPAQQSAGTGSASKPAPPANPFDPQGKAATQSAAADDIAAKFEKAALRATGRRHTSTSEAGESNSSLNIGTPGLLLQMSDLAHLPKVELVTEFKCVEGWSQITQWAGYRLRDFIDAYPPALVNGREPRYVYMETPDSNYYAGYSMLAARHPQSLLVTEMSGKPLTSLHGAPLRLHMPIKYGYKQLKRIGLISYTDTKPDDFWARLGYDWYAGL